MERKITIPLGVVMERRRIDHPWCDHRWSVVSVFAGAAPCDPKGPWARLRSDDVSTSYHAGTLPLELFAGETAGYRTNLSQKPPKIFTVLRPFEDPEGGRELVPFHVTACVVEAQDYLDGDERVDVVAMPEALVAMIGDFVAAHHVEQVFVKRKRKRHTASEEPGGPPPIAGEGRS